MRIGHCVCLLLLGAASALPLRAGSLNPPGAPGSTDRTPIYTLPMTISAPGSYVLMRDITTNEAFYITSPDVTIDLNGFTIRGTAASSVAVRSEAVHNIVIRNGTFTDFDGTTLFIPGAFDVVLEDLRIRNGGFTGINALNQVQIRDCLIESCVVWGIDVGHGALISGTTVRSCGSADQGGGIQVGDNSLLLDCNVELNTGIGIRAGRGCVLSRCVASNTAGDGSNTGAGFVLGEGCNATDCTATSNQAMGFSAGSNVRLSGCVADANVRFGILLSNNTVLAGCTATNTRAPGSGGGGFGIQLNGGCILIDCLASGNANDGIFTVSNGNRFSSCVASSNGGAGFDIASGSSAMDCVANSNALDGFLLRGTNLVTGCTAIGNVMNGFHLPGGSSDSLLTGNLARGNTDADIRADGTTNTVAQNKTFSLNYRTVEDVGPAESASLSTNPHINY